jgi:hypothetical protein
MRRWSVIAFGVGLVGVALALAGSLLLSPRAFFDAWLAAYLCCLSVPLGALALLMAYDLTGGEWGFALGPLLEAALTTLPLFILFFLPLAVGGLGPLYPWARPSEAASLPNAFFLNVPGFAFRAASYFILWCLLGLISLRRLRRGLLGVERAGSWISGLGLFLLALSVGFAAIDWVMSLQPRWSSSIFGLSLAAYLLSTALAFFTVTAVLAGPAAAPGAGDLRARLAHLLLAAVILWAYVEFMQFLMIWEENLAGEITWYLPRLDGGWGGVAVALALGRFVIPFLVLIGRPLKRDRRMLAGICLLLLATSLLDAWWLVLPISPAGFTWIAPAAACGIGGLCLAAFLARLGATAPSPQHLLGRTGHG